MVEDSIGSLLTAASQANSLSVHVFIYIQSLEL